MINLTLCVFAMLFVVSTSNIDCSQENSCFGEPANCNPDSDCETLFHFDQNGNLDLYLRKFDNPYGYAAFAINAHPDETIEYFMCLPYEKQRLRAFAELGEAMVVTEQNVQGVVEKLGRYEFRCHFKASEYPKKFYNEQHFFVTRGTFDEAVVIVDGSQLFNLEQENADDEEEEEEMIDDEEIGTPTVHHIGVPIPRSAPVSAYSVRDSAVASKAIQRVQKIEKEDEKLVSKKIVRDVSRRRSSYDFEKEINDILRSYPMFKSRYLDTEGDDLDEEDEEIHDILNSRFQNSKGRKTHYDDEDMDYDLKKKKEDVEDMEEEEDYDMSQKYDVEDEDSDKAYDTYLDNSSASASKIILLVVSLLIVYV